MSVYILAIYDIVDPDAYAPYVPGVVPLLAKHGAEILVAEYDAQTLEGAAGGTYVVLRFETEAAAMAWYDDPEYQPIKKIRMNASSNGRLALARAFVPPEAAQ